MKDYKKLIEALRCCSKSECGKCPFEWEPNKAFCFDAMCVDAATAIEELQAEVERLKDNNEELREKQSFIDQWGAKWMTSAKDVPTSAYQHGYADGFAEATQRLESKHGEWIRFNNPNYNPFDASSEYLYQCPFCGAVEYKRRKRCPECGAIMDGKDG